MPKLDLLRPLWLLLSLVGCSVWAPAAQAQGTVQLSLRGQLAMKGGSRLVVRVGALVGNPKEEEAELEEREIEVALHLAEGTTAADFSALLHQRLELAGFPTMKTMPRDVNGLSSAQLFLERVLFVELRMGRGIDCTVTTCDGPVRTLRFLAAQAVPGTGSLTIAGSARHGHNQRLSRSSFQFPLANGEHPSALSERLFSTATEKNWIAERSGPTEWSPMKFSDGSRIEGMSISLESLADWGLHVELPRTTAQ